MKDKVKRILQHIYGDTYKEEYTTKIFELFQKWEAHAFLPVQKPSEKNIYLITYGDTFVANQAENPQAGLETLATFLKKSKAEVTDIHLLPMFPYTSDDGFSVVDYLKINPTLGNWEDITNLHKSYRLMFDFVANHVSKSHEWFQLFLQDDAYYRTFFTTYDPTFNTKNVVRPRVLPLFHQYENKTVWTTFSEDQVDLNYQSIDVLLETTNILFEYVSRGASSIRLDAIGFIWKKSGTTSIHLEEAHLIIQLWRMLVSEVAPHVQLITETNVPHKENITYFGNGLNEAHMVYQFALPPLTLHAFLRNDASYFQEWLSTISKISDEATYFNFLASHDGIGLRPIENILPLEEQKQLIENTVNKGGKISFKNNSDGSQTAYEMNINYLSAISTDNEDESVKRFVASHAILLSMMGVPALYVHSLIGSLNDVQGMEESGVYRRINREKVELEDILNDFQNTSRRNSIFTQLQKIMKVRKEEPLFSPYVEQSALNVESQQVIAFKRYDKTQEVHIYVNVGKTTVVLPINKRSISLMDNQIVEDELSLEPYAFVYLKMTCD